MRRGRTGRRLACSGSRVRWCGSSRCSRGGPFVGVEGNGSGDFLAGPEPAAAPLRPAELWPAESLPPRDVCGLGEPPRVAVTCVAGAVVDVAAVELACDVVWLI